MPAAERLAGGAVRTGRNGGRRRCSLNQPRLLERVVGENNAFLAYVSAFSTRHQFPRLSSSTAETAVQSAHGLIVPRRPSDDQERKPGREHRCERGGNGRQTESECEEVSKTLGALGRPPSCRGTHGITHAQRPPISDRGNTRLLARSAGGLEEIFSPLPCAPEERQHCQRKEQHR